jgi:hypothetical protein
MDDFAFNLSIPSRPIEPEESVSQVNSDQLLFSSVNNIPSSDVNSSHTNPIVPSHYYLVKNEPDSLLRVNQMLGLPEDVCDYQ